MAKSGRLRNALVLTALASPVAGCTGVIRDVAGGTVDRYVGSCIALEWRGPGVERAPVPVKRTNNGT
jgi:hypothetical protein